MILQFVRGLYTRTAVARHPCFIWAFLLIRQNQQCRLKTIGLVAVHTCVFSSTQITRSYSFTGYYKL